MRISITAVGVIAALASSSKAADCGCYSADNVLMENLTRDTCSTTGAQMEGQFCVSGQADFPKTFADACAHVWQSGSYELVFERSACTS